MDLNLEGDVTLKQKERPLILSKCVNCQKVKGKNGDKKLISTRNPLIKAQKFYKMIFSKI